MDQIGIRELRHRLREYVARVAAGERFEVTVFDRPLAELGPIRRAGSSMDRLVAEGRVTRAANEDTTVLPTPVSVTSGTTATAALIAERRDDGR